MDFEEQLEKVEKSPYPSLVGASMKSADDSPHKNYIHPEKYTGKSRSKPSKKSILNTSLGASLDDLVSEGALLGSEEDFDRFLDDKGNVLSDAKYTAEDPSEKPAPQTPETHKPVHGLSLKTAESSLVDDTTAVLSPMKSSIIDVPQDEDQGSTKPLYEHENYSTPNLSEYQVGHQISDHAELLDSVQSYDLSKLPTADDSEARSKTINAHPLAAIDSSAICPSNLRSNSGIATNKLGAGQIAQVSDTDSFHTPYFQSDDRSMSRSISSVAFRGQSPDRSRSRSKSAMTPHLARGDNYKNTHDEAPSKYELPADMNVEENEEQEEVQDDRRSRQSKPTLGDSIAAAEANKLKVSDPESVTRDPSLVTSGDYTNFNADGHDSALKGSNWYSFRSQSSTNYLRSISRSRSRKPVHEAGTSSTLNEKNDANTEELEREGALVSDDPYSQVDDLDNMMKKVLKESAEKSAERFKSSLSSTGDEGKTEEGRQKPIAEDATADFAEKSENKNATGKTSVSDSSLNSHLKDIEEAASSKEHTQNNSTYDLSAVSEQNLQRDDQEQENQSQKSQPQKKADVNDVSAEEKDAETNEQLLVDKAPAVSASNIHVSGIVVHEPEDSVTHVDEKATVEQALEEAVEGHVNDVSAEERELEAHEQVMAAEGPAVSADDIHVNGLAASSSVPEESEVSQVEVSAEEEIKESEDQLIVEIAPVLTADDIHTEQPAKEVVSDSSNPTTKEEVSAAEPKDLHTSVVSETVDPETTAELPSEKTESPFETTSETPPEEEEQSINDSKKNLEETVETTSEPVVASEVTKTYSLEASDEKIEVDSEPSNLITESDNIAADPQAKDVKGESSNFIKIEEEEDFEVSAEDLRRHLESLPVFLYTSLAGGMQIITRTNRLATILQANGIKFEHRDLGTDEDAKKIWRRHAQGKTLPGVVRGDDFIGNWEFIEEVNEDYRVKEVLYETL